MTHTTIRGGREIRFSSLPLRTSRTLRARMSTKQSEVAKTVDMHDEVLEKLTFKVLPSILETIRDHANAISSHTKTLTTQQRLLQGFFRIVTRHATESMK